MRFELIPSAWKAENLPLIYIRESRKTESKGIEPLRVRFKSECLNHLAMTLLFLKSKRVSHIGLEPTS